MHCIHQNYDSYLYNEPETVKKKACTEDQMFQEWDMNYFLL